MDHDHGDEAEVMVVGDEGPEGEPAPEERAVELVDELRALLLQLTGGVEGEMEEEPMEEGGSGRADPARHPADDRRRPDRTRPMEEAQVRQLVRTALKRVMERKQ